MKNIAAALLGILLFTSLTVASAAENPDLDRLQGKWECKRTDEQGQKVTMTLEIKKDKLKFKVAGESTLYGTADVKVEKLGPFKTFIARNIKAGSSEDDLNDVNEDYSHVYQLDGSTLYVVSNFDEQRERGPAMDVYKKVSK